MAYNMTSFVGSTNPAGMITSINSLTNGVFFGVLMVVLFVIFMFIMMRNSPPAESIFASGMVCMVLSLMFLAMGALDVVWVIGFSTVSGVAGVALYLNR